MGWSWVNVRFGSKCDIGRRPDYVTFAPESDIGNGPCRGALPAARETKTVAALHHSLTQPQALRRPRAAAQAPPPAINDQNALQQPMTYSITSSASEISLSVTASPSALAIFALITSSNFVG